MQTLESLATLPSNDSTVSHLAPLVGSCYECEQVVAEAIQASACSEFRECVGRIRQLLNECGFQLRVEMQRISDGGAGVFEQENSVRRHQRSCEAVLSNLLDNYRRVLNMQIPPHTRAMIKRQHDQLQRLCRELTDFVQALQGLLQDVRA
jgi:dGTP triphosphohydrolase